MTGVSNYKYPRRFPRLQANMSQNFRLQMTLLMKLQVHKKALFERCLTDGFAFFFHHFLMIVSHLRFSAYLKKCPLYVPNWLNGAKLSSDACARSGKLEWTLTHMLTVNDSLTSSAAPLAGMYRVVKLFSPARLIAPVKCNKISGAMK